MNITKHINFEVHMNEQESRKIDNLFLTGDEIRRAEIKTIKLVVPKGGIINSVKRWLKMKSGWKSIERQARIISKTVCDEDGEIIADVVFQMDADIANTNEMTMEIKAR